MRRLHRGELRLVRIGRHLADRAGAPASRGSRRGVVLAVMAMLSSGAVMSRFCQDGYNRRRGPPAPWCRPATAKGGAERQPYSGDSCAGDDEQAGRPIAGAAAGRRAGSPDRLRRRCDGAVVAVGADRAGARRPGPGAPHLRAIGRRTAAPARRGACWRGCRRWIRRPTCPAFAETLRREQAAQPQWLTAMLADPDGNVLVATSVQRGPRG